MKTVRVTLSVFLVLLLGAPLPALFGQSTTAQPGWTEEFLLKLKAPDTAKNEAAPPPALRPVIGQIFQTGTVPISLHEVIAMMLDHNLDIRSNRFSPRLSALQTLIFYRVLEPSIRFSGTVIRDTSAPTSQTSGALTLSNLRHQFAVSYSQLLPWGTSVGIDATMNRQSNNSITNTFNPSYIGNIRYSLVHPLLRNGGRFVTTRQIVVAQNNEKLSEIDFEMQLIDLVVQAQRAYWDLVFAANDLKVKERSLEIAQQTLVENKLKVDIGTLAPIEVKQTESEVANRRQQLIQSSGSVVSVEDQIKRMISSDTDPSLFLVKLAALDTPRPPGSTTIPTLEQAVRLALENRPELRSAAIELQNRDIDVDFTRNQKLPALDATFTFNQNGTGGTRTVRGGEFGGPITEVIPGGVWDAFKQLFGFDYRGYSVGLALEIPLSNKAAKADYDRAVYERRLTESRVDGIKAQIALEVRNALTQIEQAEATIETSRVARELAQERVQAEQTKFNVGTSTLRFVLEEQRNVAQAETTELQSLVNFTKAIVDLDKAMGLTLSKNSVEIDKALATPAVASRTLSQRAEAGN
jgi:outer membrane protein TolC